MANREEKEPNNRFAIVIDGWEKGIAGSAYAGIANMRNMNISYQPGVAYVNYARLAATISGGTMTKPKFYAQSPAGLIYILDDSQQVWKQNTVGGTTFNLLSGNPSSGTGNGMAYWNNYLVVFGGTAIDICGDGTGDGGITSGNWNNTGTAGVWPIKSATITLTGTISQSSSGNANLTASVTAGSTSATLASNWTGATGVYLVTFTDGETRNALLTNGATTMDWSGSGSSTIPATGLTNNVQNSFFYGGPNQATISSYTDAQGNSRSFWNGPTGTYQITLSTGQVLFANFVQGSSLVTWISLIIANATDSISLTAVFSGQHMAYVSRNDGNLYFCNGSNVGSISEIPTQVFNKNASQSYTFNYSALGLPMYETAVWLADLQTNLLVAGNKLIYPWDRVSTSWTTPMPITEQIYMIVNMTNIIYVFAGVKGNIYVTNGYSISVLKKIPDSLWGLIDPYVQWGGYMTHRNKLYFQAYASTNGGTPSASGIFAIDLVSAQLPTELDTAGALNLENQNSFGYTPTASSSNNGLLIDVSTSVEDMYFSAWYNNSAGGVDYNTTTLYQNNEPVIETDLIPTGTYLQSRTFENVEYKLDRELAVGDEITLYYRTSLTDSYVLIGTTNGTNTQILSDNFNSNIQNAQWVQFKVTFLCASSGSSRIPLREVRLHGINN